MRPTVGTRSRLGAGRWLALVVAACVVVSALAVAGCGSAAKPDTGSKSAAAGNKAGAAGNRAGADRRKIMALDGLGLPGSNSGPRPRTSVEMHASVPLYRTPANPRQFERFCENIAARAVGQGPGVNLKMIQTLKHVCLTQVRRSYRKTH